FRQSGFSLRLPQRKGTDSHQTPLTRLTTRLGSGRPCAWRRTTQMINRLFNARAWSTTEDDAPQTQTYMAPATEIAPLISPDDIDQSLFLRCGCSSCAKAAVERDPDAPQST